MTFVGSLPQPPNDPFFLLKNELKTVSLVITGGKPGKKGSKPEDLFY